MQNSQAKQYVGRIWKSSQEIPVYIDNNRLVDENSKDLTDLVQFILSNPWGGDASSTKLKEMSGDYRYRYKVIHLDTLDVTLFGFGHTPKEAEENCCSIVKQIEAM